MRRIVYCCDFCDRELTSEYEEYGPSSLPIDWLGIQAVMRLPRALPDAVPELGVTHLDDLAELSPDPGQRQMMAEVSRRAQRRAQIAAANIPQPPPFLTQREARAQQLMCDQCVVRRGDEPLVGALLALLLVDSEPTTAL